MSVGLVLGGATSQTDIVLELLSRRCEALGKWFVYNIIHSWPSSVPK